MKAGHLTEFIVYSPRIHRPQSQEFVADWVDLVKQ